MADTTMPVTTSPTPGRDGAVDTPVRDSVGSLSNNALAFRSSSRPVVFTYLMIVVAAAIPWLLGFDSIAVWLTVVVVVGAAGTMIWINGQRREKLYEAEITRLQNSSNQWEARWRLLSDDSQQTSTALAQMADGVIVLSDVGNILLINPAARRLLFLEETTTYVGRRLSEIRAIPRSTIW